MEPFDYERVYGDYRGARSNRARIWAEDHDEDGINIGVEDGDNSGRGAERTWASITVEREEAFKLHAWLSEALYGDRETVA